MWMLAKFPEQFRNLIENNGHYTQVMNSLGCGTDQAQDHPHNDFPGVRATWPGRAHDVSPHEMLTVFTPTQTRGSQNTDHIDSCDWDRVS